MNKKLCAFLMAIVVMATLTGGGVSSRMVAAQSGRTQRPEPSQPPAPPPPPKWEYAIVNDFIPEAYTNINRLGEQGFEIIGFDVTTYNRERPYYHIILRRPKP